MPSATVWVAWVSYKDSEGYSFDLADQSDVDERFSSFYGVYDYDKRESGAVGEFCQLFCHKFCLFVYRLVPSPYGLAVISMFVLLGSHLNPMSATLSVIPSRWQSSLERWLCGSYVIWLRRSMSWRHLWIVTFTDHFGGIAGVEIFRDMFFENPVHHFPLQHFEVDLLKDALYDRSNSCARLIIHSLQCIFQ